MSKLLIVEDEKNLRTLYEKEFEKEGYEVFITSCAEEAIDAAEKVSPDLVIMDIRMQKMNGIEAMKKILNNNKDLPIIINSAYSSYMDDFMSWAAKAYIIKSSDLTELKSKVKEYIDA